MDRLLKISVQWSIAIKKANRNSYEKESRAQHISMPCINSQYFRIANTVHSSGPAPLSLKDSIKVEKKQER